MFINKAFIFGNLTRDVELRQTASGLAVATAGVATNRIYKNQQGEKTEEVTFHNVTLFGRQAELAQQYLRKGSSVYFEGRLRTSTWEQDGQKRYKTEIIAESMQFGPKKTPGMASQQEEAVINSQPQGKEVADIDPNDIPF